MGLLVSDCLVSVSLCLVLYLTTFYPYVKGLAKVMKVCLILNVTPLTAGTVIYFISDLLLKPHSELK